jgi:hypothetical protein
MIVKKTFIYFQLFKKVGLVDHRGRARGSAANKLLRGVREGKNQ